MKKTILPFAAAAVSAAIFAGCEWGGVHSGESWNDAYSWANFTGTYKLVTNLAALSTSSSSESSTTTNTVTTVVKQGSKNFTVGANVQSYQVSTGQANITEGSVSVEIVSASGGKYTLTDKGSGTLQGSDPAVGGTAVYATGTINLTFNGTHSKYTGTVTYSYSGTTTSSSSSSSSTSTSTSTPITWLNLTQQGNLLTFRDNNNVTYSGRITGASCPKASEGGYMPAGHIRFTFEASAANGATMSGAISGDWSGASSATTGTLANRTIDATYHRGKTTAQFQAVSGTTVISAKEIAPYVGTTD